MKGMIAAMLHRMALVALGAIGAAACDTIGPDDGGDDTAGFIKVFGGPGDDEGRSVRQTSDGGFIILGTTSAGEHGKKDMLLIRTDADGVEQWSRHFGGAGDDEGRAVRQTADGGFILAGVTASFGTGTQAYLVKVSSAGEESWSKAFGTSGDDRANAILAEEDGYLLAGSARAGDGTDFLVIKTGTDGAVSWSKRYGGPVTEVCNDVAPSGDGYLLTGTTTLATGSYMTAVEIDGTGTERAFVKYIGTNGVAFAGMTASDGTYLMAGYTRAATAGAIDSMALVRIDRDGNPIWSRGFGGDGGSRAYSLLGVDGGYLIGGYNRGVGTLRGDYYLVRLDAEGRSLWTRAFGGGDEDEVRSIDAARDGGFIAVGTSRSFVTGVNGGEVMMLKVDQSGAVER